MAEADDMLAELYGSPSDLTTADVIRAMPYQGHPMDLKAQMRDRAMRGQPMSPEMTARIAPDPEREANLPWLRKALDWGNEHAPAAMLAASFVGSRVPALPTALSSVAPKRLPQGLKGETGFAYHATNQDRLNEIARSGELRVHRPGDFTDQGVWPDGSREMRAYFGASPEHLWQFAPEEGTPVILRARLDKELKREDTGDLYARKPISSQRFEYLGQDDAWHPVGIDLSPEARLSRAREQGYDLDKPLYRSGTNPDRTELQPHGPYHGHKGVSGVSLADSPELAARYLDRFPDVSPASGEPLAKNMMKVYTRPGQVREFDAPIVPDDPLHRWGRFISQPYRWPTALDGVDTAVFPDYVTRHGPVQHRVSPAGGKRAGRVIEGKEYILRDPTRVRSVNAIFDPMNKGSANLMAGLAGGAVTTADLLRSIYGAPTDQDKGD